MAGNLGGTGRRNAARAELAARLYKSRGTRRDLPHLFVSGC